MRELIDNSVDAFLKAQRSADSDSLPMVFVSIPMTDSEASKITIRDNGPGMDAGTLQNAVRAGWTGNAPFDSLGFYGMGLKIAMARLGTVTKVWSTRTDDTEWVGVEIDFGKLQQQGHFKTPKLTRPKADPCAHGTEIVIERLKQDQRQWFAKAVNRSAINKQLARVYSAMLRPNGVPLSFMLYVNNKGVEGENHCIWGGEESQRREVQTSRYGTINAYQPFDVRLQDRPYCVKCLQWLACGETACPSCGGPEGVVQRERRVHGWLGIQRYLSATDYGFDFIRHGRKIEIANKDLFYWVHDETREEEYPIDDPRHRGRIVGEIHIDHCRVTYTKDRFDRNDPAWDEMVRIGRGEGPLRPDKAEQLGYGQNTSPLFLLFQAFRRSNPHKAVAGVYKKLLVVPDNELAEEMAERFHRREVEYQTDQKWWELVEEADRKLLFSPAPGTPAPGGDVQIGPPPQAAPIPQAPAPAAPQPVRRQIASLSREYRDEVTGQRWDVRAYEVEASDPELSGGLPWRLKAQASGTHEYMVDAEHAIFQSVSMTPLDALLADLAWAAMDFERGNPTGATFGKVLASLRDKYAGTSKLDPVQLSGTANQALTAIARGVAQHIQTEGSRALFEELSTSERDAVQHRMATRSVPNPQQVIERGRFLEFAPRKALLRFFEEHPDSSSTASIGMMHTHHWTMVAKRRLRRHRARSCGTTRAFLPTRFGWLSRTHPTWRLPAEPSC